MQPVPARWCPFFTRLWTGCWSQFSVGIKKDPQEMSAMLRTKGLEYNTPTGCSNLQFDPSQRTNAFAFTPVTVNLSGDPV